MCIRNESLILETGGGLGRADFVIHHFGFAVAPQEQTRKNIYYRELSVQKVQEMPRSAQAHFELGMVETSVFTAATTSIFLSDANSSSTIAVTVGVLASSGTGGLGLATDITSATNAQSALTEIDSAISTVASTRGTIGAGIIRLQSATNVIINQVQNLTLAQSSIVSADISQVVGNLSRYSILSQTGIAALSQANSTQQNVLQLLR